MKKLGKTIQVKVTADDIAQGTIGNPWSCPIARAVARRAGLDINARMADGRRAVGAASEFVRVFNKRYPMSSAGAAFIRAFDASEPVKPIVLRLTRE